jgi:hypothetical protein
MQRLRISHDVGVDNARRLLVQAAIFRTPRLSDKINLGLCFSRYSIALEESTSSCVSLMFCIMKKS